MERPLETWVDQPPPVTRADIERAEERIAGHVRRTPVLRLEAGAFGVEGELILKLELLQRTGSFKLRGAFNRLLSAEVPPAGVVAASGGTSASPSRAPPERPVTRPRSSCRRPPRP